MIIQQGDVQMFQTPDGGEITVTDGLVVMGGGLETMVFLSLFGGNQDDPGGTDVSKSWWGNIVEPDRARQYRSETQNALISLPATSANLRRVEDAAARDLAWMVREKVASSVDVVASVQGLNRVVLGVTIVADGDERDFVFAANWKAGA